MSAIPLPEGSNIADSIRRLRAIDAEIFGTLYANAGTLGDLTVTGILTMGPGGVFRTAPSGKRVEFAIAELGHIRFYTGASGETGAPGIFGSGATDPNLTIVGGTRSGASASIVEFDSTNKRLLLQGLGDPAGGIDSMSLSLVGSSNPTFSISGLRAGSSYILLGGFYNGTSGQIQFPDGTTLLPGVSYASDTSEGMFLDPVTGSPALTQEAWTAPTLLAGWVNYGSGEQTARYRKDSSGTVWVQGVIKNGTTTSGTLILTLPVGYRPALTLNLTGLANNALCNFKMQSDGNLVTRAGWAANFTAINISFPAA